MGSLGLEFNKTQGMGLFLHQAKKQTQTDSLRKWSEQRTFDQTMDSSSMNGPTRGFITNIYMSLNPRPRARKSKRRTENGQTKPAQIVRSF